MRQTTKGPSEKIRMCWMACMVHTVLCNSTVAKAYRRPFITNFIKIGRKRLVGDTAHAADTNVRQEPCLKTRDLKEGVASRPSNCISSNKAC